MDIVMGLDSTVIILISLFNLFNTMGIVLEHILW